VRGANEPPHYVYLDDRACYAIWISQQYTKHELKTFWPFDFDHAGRLRTRRLNRGRPAYLNDSYLKYARGTLRDKTKTYEFCGAPEYALARIGKSKNAQPHVKIELGSEHIQSGVARVTESIGRSTTPRSSGNKAHRANHNGRLGTARTPWESSSSPRSHISGPTDGSVFPMGLTRNTVQGPPYFEQPAAAFRANPRPRAGDLAGVKGKSIDKEEENDDEDEMDGKEILLSSKVIRKKVVRKRIKIEEGMVVTKIVEPKPVKREGKGYVVVLDEGYVDGDGEDDEVVPERTGGRSELDM
jgi:hypothetical protein